MNIITHTAINIMLHVELQQTISELDEGGM